MARGRFRSFPLYVDDDKVAECRQNQDSLETNDEAQFDSDGYAGHTDGSGLRTVTFTMIIPVKGTKLDIDGIIQSRKYVQLGLIVNGKFAKSEGRIKSRSYKSDVKNGVCEGDFTFEGGEPEYA